MEDRVAALEEQVRDVVRSIRDMDDRLRAMEAGARAPAPAVAAAAPDEVPGERTAPWSQGVATIAGRTIMVFGGAFLLRAVTESEAVLDVVGVGLGLAYAAFWMWRTDARARAGRVLDATFHGSAATFIGFPLVWEASTKFDILGPAASAAALLAGGAVLLWIAWARRLYVLASIVVAVAVTTGVGLVFATREMTPYATALYLLAAASLAVSYHREWPLLRWPAAIALDTLVLALIWLTGRPNQGWIEPASVVALGWLLAATYCAAVVARTLVRGRHIALFGGFQIAVVLALALEGGRRLLDGMGAETAWVGAAALALSAAALAGVFLRTDRRPEDAINRAYYTALAVVLAAVGLWRLAPGHVAAVCGSALALGAAVLGAAPHRPAMRAGAAVLALASVAGTVLPRVVADAFKGPDFASADLDAATIASLVLAALAWVALRRRVGPDRASPDWTLPGLVLALVALAGVGAILVRWIGAAVAAGDAPGAADLGALAVVRTAVLSVSAVLLAVAAGGRRRLELRQLGCAALAGAAVKLVVEDFAQGRPATLFLSLALFGGALALMPTCLRARPVDR